MKATILAVFLFSLPGLSLAESDTDPLGELSAGQLKSMRQAGWAVLTARAKATAGPDIEQFRQGIQTLRQELQVLATQPVVTGGGEVVIQAAGTSSAPAISIEARAVAKADKTAAKQRVRDAMAGLREQHTQMKQRKRTREPLADTDVMNKVSAKLTALQTELDDALAKPDAELHTACKALLTRIETRRLMIGQPLDDQPTLSTRTRHRR